MSSTATPIHSVSTVLLLLVPWCRGRLLLVMARYTVTTTRSIMSPFVFEAILFLRMNRVLWDERTVMYASAEVRADQKDELLQMKLDLAKDDDDSEEVGVGIANATEDEE